MKEVDLVIVGGGPAGISAAIEAARRGVSVILIDENRSLGGKVLKQDEGGLKIDHTDDIEAEIADQLLSEFERIADKVSLYLNTEVWSINAQRVVELFCEDQSIGSARRIQGKKLLISAGALERAIPFPGWTLPGVYTVGGLNSLIKKGVTPGKNFLIAGSGPLLLVLARNLIRAGAKVSGIIEAASKKQIAAKAFQILRSAGALRLRQGFNYLRNVFSQGIPVYNSHVVSKAIGNEAVNKAVITKIDRAWKPLKGTEREIPIDAVAVGYSLIPSIELTRVCGCNHQYDQHLGYWKVQRSDRMETSVPGVFVAGDAVHIKGYAPAIDEGRLAGLEVCLQLGYIDNNRAEPLIRALQKKLRQAARFGKIIDAISSPQAGILDIISDDTFVCRCEEVTLADIRTAVGNGASDVNDIKRRTRLGMGHCQGRFCGQVMNELLWKLSGRSRERELFTPRIPAKAVPFKALMR